MSTDARELDVFACALDGVTQIEASAGTGKTWNICALYVRLLLEKDLRADQILVVTFTKAATAELHERIRKRLAQLEQALADGDDSGDPFVQGLLEHSLGAGDLAGDPELALKRVRRALRGFDQAAIHTIHAFCQRALQEAPFAAAMPFTLETEADDTSLRFDVAAEFWRNRVEPDAARMPGFAQWLVQRGAGPASLEMLLAQRLKKPLAELAWGDTGCDDDMAVALDECFDAARRLWLGEREQIAQHLEQAASQLNQRTHKPQQIDAALAAWDRYFADGDRHAPLPKDALKLTASALATATKAKCTTPAHAFFDSAEALALALTQAEQRHVAHWFELVRDWLETGPVRVAERKRTARVVSFDDLLSNLHRALVEHPWLADTLRERYPAALIDEFQDTDPLQFAIFSRIFAPRGPLFLVGDPKQAIYSFRAADLHTYLDARRLATAGYTLAVNQRSSAGIVAACNRLFSANPRAFILEGLDYHPVRAAARERPPFVDRSDPLGHAGHGGADMRVWLLPDAGGTAPAKREAERAAAEASAAEIARLLRAARTGDARIGDTPLAPADIAVLVQTHRQGSLMKRVLRGWGIGSVELAQASVFASADAEQLERLLLAIDTPGDLRRLRAALATDWVGLDAATLWAIEHSADPVSGVDADSASWVERFSRYRALWHERGFAPMWRTLMRELRIAQRLAGAPDGERRLTDVNHLGELVQARASEQPGIAPTLRWLAAQRADPGGGEDAQLRLESDRDLVQIVTVHKSKGLEYAVVFCPFLTDGALRVAGAQKGLPVPREYHRDDGRAVLHFGCDDDQAQRADRSILREQAAERARLIYVALTRAVYRCHLVAGVYASGAHASTKEARQSVLNWLVAGASRSFDAWLADPPEAAEIDECWRALEGADISVMPLPAIAARAPLPPLLPSHERLRARAPRHAVRETWRVASFSSLASGGARDEPFAGGQRDVRPDHDELALGVATAAAWIVAGESAAASGIGAAGTDVAIDAPSGTLPDVSADDDILHFPRGPAAGECLHRLLELADFGAPSTWPDAIARALEERPPDAPDVPAERLAAMMARLLGDLTTTPIERGFTLADIPPARRLTELEFVFPVADLDIGALRRLLASHGFADVPIDGNTLSGYLRGFIDAVVEFDGRFWIIDWKSNHLGHTPDAYRGAGLSAAMTEHAYVLQALIYTIALHRYLQMRLPNYDYDTHFGASLYLFLRGVRPSWPGAGIERIRPTRGLIDALDALFAAPTRR